MNATPEQSVIPQIQIVSIKSWNHPALHEFQAMVCPEEEGGYSIFAINYPGVISQGETIEEAEDNIKDAFLSVLNSRKNHGEEMEYSHRPTVEKQPGCKIIRVTFNA